MTIAPKAMTAQDWGLIAILSLIWGSAFFLIVIVLRDMPANTMVFLRFALAIPPMLLWLRYTGEDLPMTVTIWKQFTILGALNIAIPLIIFTWGQARIPSGLASVLNATTPLWGVIVAHFLTQNEKATPLRLFGVLTGFAGVGVMMGTGALSGAGENVMAQLACAGATLFYGLAGVYALRMGDTGLSPMQIATGQVCTASLMMIPVVLLTETPWALPMPGLAALASLATLALVGTSFAYLLYFRLIASAGASNALLIPLTIPPIAILLGALFLEEVILPQQMAGIALIALGLLALDGRMLRRLAPSRSVP
jgi:drug/metabolite transporter (DMT)-like permease